MTSPSNLGVPKTFMYGLVNPTPQTEADIGRWVPIIVNEDGNVTVQTEAQPRPGVVVFTDVRVTSAQPNTLRNDSLDPGNDSVLTVMAQDVNSFPLVYNEFASDVSANGLWNLKRGNQNPIFFPSATYSATQETGNQTNPNNRGIHVIVNVTDIFAGTPSITVRIQARDPEKLFSTFRYYDLLVSLPITSVGTNVLKVYPGINTIPNGAASDILPWQYNVRIEHADAQDIEYSVAGNLVV